MFTRKTLLRVVVGGIAGLTLAAGLTVGTGFFADSVLAQTSRYEQIQSYFMPARSGRGIGERFGHRGFGRQGTDISSNSLLANSLGITPVDLRTAEQNAKNALLDQAVADGIITSEQATALKEGQRSSGDISDLRAFLADADQDAALAQALGISEEALATARDTMIQKGVEAGLITQEQGNKMLLRQKLEEAVRTAVEQSLGEAVAEGLITQEEADAMLDGRQSQFGLRGMSGEAGPKGFGRGHRGFSPRGGFFGGEFEGDPQDGSEPANILFDNA